MISPAVVMRPTLSFPSLVNQRFPSGPATMWPGKATPDSLPLHNVYSPGDAVIVLGLLIVVHAACHRQKAASSRARPTGSS